MKLRWLISFFLGFIMLLTVILGIRWAFQQKTNQQVSQKTQMVNAVKDVLQLALLEIHVSQVFEAKRDHVRMLSVPIPFTAQKSLIVAEGKALVGYDLCNTKITITGKNHVDVDLPAPSVLSLDLNYRFIFENDSFMNRITPEDRSEFLSRIKEDVRSTLISESRRLELAEKVKKMADTFSKHIHLNLTIN